VKNLCCFVRGCVPRRALILKSTLHSEFVYGKCTRAVTFQIFMSVADESDGRFRQLETDLKNTLFFFFLLRQMSQTGASGSWRQISNLSKCTMAVTFQICFFVADESDGRFRTLETDLKNTFFFFLFVEADESDGRFRRLETDLKNSQLQLAAWREHVAKDLSSGEGNKVYIYIYIYMYMHVCVCVCVCVYVCVCVCVCVFIYIYRTEM
jgi:hypothetical protein